MDSLQRFYLHCVKDFISFFNSTYPVENIHSNWTKLIHGPSKLEQSGFFFILKFAHRNSNKKEKVSIDGNRNHSAFLSHLCVVLPREVYVFIWWSKISYFLWCMRLKWCFILEWYYNREQSILTTLKNHSVQWRGCHLSKSGISNQLSLASW